MEAKMHDKDNKHHTFPGELCTPLMADCFRGNPERDDERF